MAKLKRASTPSDVAGELGVSVGTVRLWCNRADSPCPHTLRDRRLYLDLSEVRGWMEANGVTGRPGRPGEPLNKNLEAARTRKESALADKYEMQVARERSELVSAADAQARWLELVGIAKNLMMAIPAAVAPVLVGMTTAEIEAELSRRVHAVLLELSGSRSGT